MCLCRGWFTCVWLSIEKENVCTNTTQYLVNFFINSVIAVVWDIWINLSLELFDQACYIYMSSEYLNCMIDVWKWDGEKRCFFSEEKADDGFFSTNAWIFAFVNQLWLSLLIVQAKRSSETLLIRIFNKLGPFFLIVLKHVLWFFAKAQLFVIKTVQENFS